MSTRRFRVGFGLGVRLLVLRNDVVPERNIAFEYIVRHQRKETNLSMKRLQITMNAGYAGASMGERRISGQVSWRLT
jgi:hypothetical protein